ncbi:MAG: ATPase, partial [Acidobacteria bacterium]|nr:ATPase [Acidobacteriota bacterium]
MADRPRYYLGLDAGASKTHALIADADGHIVGVGLSGPGNWEGVGLDGARAAYAQALEAALADAGIGRAPIAAAGYGLAGYDFPSDDGRLRPVIESLGVPGPYFLDNDTLIALRAGTSQPYGVVCIAGSGSTKAGRNRHGQVFRSWGVGDEMGDWGGGGDICRAAVGSVARAFKGIDPPTALTGPLLAHFGVPDVTTLVERIARQGDHRIDFAAL